MTTQPKAPPVYRPSQNGLAVQPKPANPFRLETRPAPPVYRPTQTSHPAMQLKPAGNFRVETRSAPPVYRPQQGGVSAKPAKSSLSPRTLQRSTSKKGKMGGSYFTQSKDEDEIAMRLIAEEKLGLTSAHGSSKHGKDSGISNKTLTEERKINENIRKQKDKKYKDSRPKPKIKEESSKSAFEKALAKAEKLIEASDNLGEAQEQFDKYLTDREITLSEKELDAIYSLFVPSE